MKLTITRMNRPEAIEYLAWQYPDPAFNIPEPTWRQQMRDIFADDGDDYYSVYDGDDFIGIFAFAFPDGILQMRVALAPDDCGHGLGREFIQAGIAYAKSRFHYQDRIEAVVAADNARAVHLFKALGFVQTEPSTQETDAGLAQDLLMTLEP